MYGSLAGLDDYLLRGPEDVWEDEDAIIDFACGFCGYDRETVGVCVADRAGRCWSWDCPSCGMANIYEGGRDD